MIESVTRTMAGYAVSTPLKIPPPSPSPPFPPAPAAPPVIRLLLTTLPVTIRIELLL
jgi:hypothetical protein